MGKLLGLGCLVLMTGFDAFPDAHALTEYADGHPLPVFSFTCWYFEQIAQDDFRRQAYVVNASDGRDAVAKCLIMYAVEHQPTGILISSVR